jgi:hypothetical protein
MQGNQECLKYPKWLAVLMAAFLLLLRASCGSYSSPGINLIPSVDQRRRSVRFKVILNCLISIEIEEVICEELCLTSAVGTTNNSAY